jgi:hypothetical protein
MSARLLSGATRAPRDTALLSHALTSAAGEHVCLLLEIHAKPKEAKLVEKECLAVAERALAGTVGDPAERLDGTLKELNGLLKAFFVSKSVDDVHMIAAILSSDGQLHVSHAGRAEAYLVRKGGASQITEYTGGKPSPTFVHIASGVLEPRDVVVFSSQRLLRALTPAQLAQLAQHPEDVAQAIVHALTTEGEHAVVASFAVGGAGGTVVPTLRSRRRAAGPFAIPALAGVMAFTRRMGASVGRMPAIPNIRSAVTSFVGNLTHPQHRRRAHFLLLAGSMASLLVVWATVQIFTASQRSKSRAELENLVAQISSQVQAAESRRMIGDVAAANEILSQAEEQAKKVMDSGDGAFRADALDLLDTIRTKGEEINNVVRIASPTVVANLASKTPDVLAQGIIGLGNGEFIAYDRQATYRILQNAVENPSSLGTDELILGGTFFERFKAQVYLMTGNTVMEVTDGTVSSMKTEDTAGWVNGIAADAYLRFLYVLAPDAKQIYKYERLTNRYSAPLEYNVNGDLTDALDMAIADGNVYVLKKGGAVLKLYRGESQPFVIRRAPDRLLETATKLVKSSSGKFYFLDPTHRRVIVASDGGASGEASYIRQYVLEGEQVGELKDLWVDSTDTRLVVIDEKRLYSIDLTTVQ